MGMFWNHRSVPRLLASTQETKELTDRLRTDLMALEQRAERLAIANEALWLLLKEKLGLTEEELAARVRDVELAGGDHAALLEAAPLACPQCKRTVSARHRQCLYCGMALTPGAPA